MVVKLPRKDGDLYSAIGLALDQWSVIEAHLCSIFAVAVSANDYAPAAAAFSAILSFEAQIGMVHAAMGQRFEKTSGEFARWSELKKRLDKLRPTRNRLAHGKVIPVVMKGGEIQYRYLPFYHFFTEKEREKFTHMTYADIVAIRKAFGDMTGSLNEFGKSIGARQQIKGARTLMQP